MFPVSIVRCGSYDRARIFDAVASAVDMLGGMSKFVPRGARVLVKPNLLYPRSKESAVTTHPEVVRAVVELSVRAGASEVTVGDSPGLAKAATVAKACGLLDALEGTGARIVEFDTAREVKGKAFPKLVLAERVVEAGVIIDVAKAKTHTHMGLTLATKNCFGCVPGLRKSQWHLTAGRDKRLFARLIADVACTVDPALSVLDAISVMEGDGPGSGTPRPFGAVLAGTDTFATDMLMARMLGYRPGELPIEAAGIELDLGPRSTDEIDVLGESPASLALRDFTRAGEHNVRFSIRVPGFIVRALKRHATPKPVIDPGLCRNCGRCADICPPKAITVHDEDAPSSAKATEGSVLRSSRGAKGDAPAIDRDACISCFCCQEICPYGAITVKEGFLSRIFTR